MFNFNFREEKAADGEEKVITYKEYLERVNEMALTKHNLIKKGKGKGSTLSKIH